MGHYRCMFFQASGHILMINILITFYACFCLKNSSNSADLLTVNSKPAVLELALAESSSSGIFPQGLSWLAFLYVKRKMTF